jgi:hypothetical protein
MNSTKRVIDLLLSHKGMVSNYFQYCSSSGVLPSCSGFEMYHQLRLDTTYGTFSRKEVTEYLRNWYSKLR